MMTEKQARRSLVKTTRRIWRAARAEFGDEWVAMAQRASNRATLAGWLAAPDTTIRMVVTALVYQQPMNEESAAIRLAVEYDNRFQRYVALVQQRWRGKHRELLNVLIADCKGTAQ